MTGGVTSAWLAEFVSLLEQTRKPSLTWWSLSGTVLSEEGRRGGAPLGAG